MKFEGAYGWAAGIRYNGTVGTIQGVGAGFTASVMCRLRRIPTGREIIFGTFKRFTDGGWALCIESDRIQMFLTQASDGSKLGNFVNGNLPATTDALSPIGKCFVSTLVWDGTNADLYINGKLARRITPTGGMTFEPTVGPALGIGSEGVEPFVSGTVIGAAYGTQVLSLAQVEDHAVSCMANAKMMDSGFANKWNFDGLAVAPASLLDEIGGVNLTRTGTPTMESATAYWL